MGCAVNQVSSWDGVDRPAKYSRLLLTVSLPVEVEIVWREIAVSAFHPRSDLQQVSS